MDRRREGARRIQVLCWFAFFLAGICTLTHQGAPPQAGEFKTMFDGDEEREEYRRKAEQCGMPLSKWIRETLKAV